MTSINLLPAEAGLAECPEAPTQRLNEFNQKLFDRLRYLRNHLSASRNVPAYYIATDVTLCAIVYFKPTSMASLSHIRGFGDKKLAAYGRYFVDAVIAHYNEFIVGQRDGMVDALRFSVPPVANPVTGEAPPASYSGAWLSHGCPDLSARATTLCGSIGFVDPPRYRQHKAKRPKRCR